MIEGTLRIEIGHKIETEARTEMIVEDLERAEETVELRIEIGLTLGTKVRRFHYCREPGHFMKECHKKKRDQAKQGEHKT